MQIHSDRFETTLPKERFFTPPTKPPVRKSTDWRAVIITGIIAVAFCAIVKQFTSLQLPVPPAPTPTWTPPPTDPPAPTPVPRLQTPVLPAPLDVPPHAQLVHVRPIGSIENNVMPDGRVLTTRYMGELPNTSHLPTRGGQLGDEWFTRADQHCWVLAPVTTGSQTIGWVDP